MLVSYFGTLMYAKMFEALDSELTNYSHIIGMDKVSGFFSVTVAIAVVYIVIALIGKVLKKNLKTEIVSAKYDDVGSGAFDYSRSPRLGYGQNNQGAQGYGNPTQSNLRSILSRPTLSPGIINPISRVIISPTVRSPLSRPTLSPIRTTAVITNPGIIKPSTVSSRSTVNLSTVSPIGRAMTAPINPFTISRRRAKWTRAR